MNILITGGTGLIGSAFIKKYSEHQYTVLSRSKSKAHSGLPTSVKVIETLAALDHLNDFDAVINLAGEAIIDKRWSAAQKNVICQSRWSITQQLCDLLAASTQAPAVFLSGSAIGAYGNRGDEILNENASTREQDFPSKICLEWEKIALQAEPYCRVVTCRTGIVLSNSGGALKKMLLPFQCGLGGNVSSGSQYMSWIHIDDHIDALQHLLNDSSLSGPVNLVAPKPVKNSQFTQALAKTLSRCALIPVPKLALKVLLGESACLLLDSQRVQPQKLLDSGFSFHYAKLDLALAALLND